MASNSENISKDSDIERLFKKFTYKCLQVIVQSRTEETVLLRSAKEPSTDYFSIALPDNPSVDDHIRKVLEGIKSWPVNDQSVCVEISLVTTDGDHMFLEVWDLSFNLISLDMSASKLQHIFTRMGITLKSLVCATRATPAYRLAKNQGEKGGGYRLNYRFYLGKPMTHALGEEYKSVKAGSVPTAFGLLNVNVSYRTKLLLSPDVTSRSSDQIQVTDNYFFKEYTIPSPRQNPRKSEPQPCSPPNRRPSPVVGSDDTYCFAVSPPSYEADFRAPLPSEFPTNQDKWPNSFSTMDDTGFSEPAIGAFSSQTQHTADVEFESPFGNLMKQSMLARQAERSKQASLDNQDSETEHQKAQTKAEGKENVDTLKKVFWSSRTEDDFVMIDKPFALDDDPRDVTTFLGAILQAPNLYEQSDNVLLDDYMSDVENLVSKLEKEMPELDAFCQSIINTNQPEEEDLSTSFS